MNVLRVDLYNQQQTRKWKEHCEKARQENRDWSCMPQLAMYLFNHKRGYVAFDDNKALWAKTKKEVIKWWDTEIKLLRIREY